MRMCSLSLWKNTTSSWRTPRICCWVSAWMMPCQPSWSRYSPRYLALLSTTDCPTVTGIISKRSCHWSRNSTHIGILTPMLYLQHCPFPLLLFTDLTLHQTGLLKWIRSPTGGRLLLVPSGGRCLHLPLTITHGQQL